MLRWDIPRARRVLGTSAELAKASKVLKANQESNNGFLIAGIIGATTANRKILFIQTAPTVWALVVIFDRV